MRHVTLRVIAAALLAGLSACSESAPPPGRVVLPSTTPDAAADEEAMRALQVRVGDIYEERTQKALLRRARRAKRFLNS